MSQDLRPTLTAYVRQRVQAFDEGFRHHLAVFGPVGSGKSFLLQQGVSSCAQGRALPVVVTLQRDSMRAFLRRFSTAVLESAITPDRDEPLEALLARAAITLPNTTAAIAQLGRYQTGRLQAEAFTHALDVIPVLHQELQRPCIIVLDEFLHLEGLGISHAFHELGKRVMTWPFALFLLSSSSTFRARDIVREQLQLLFGQFEVIALGPTEPSAAIPWMARELPESESMSRVLQFVHRWLGGSPWSMSVLLRRMKERLLLKRDRTLDAETLLVRAAWDVLGHPNGALYQWCAAQADQALHVRDGLLAREALGALARGMRTTQAIAGYCGTRRNVSLALQALVERDLIQRKGACWVIPDQLLACWLAAQPEAGQPRGAKTRQAAAKRFKQAIHTLWAQWQQATTQPFAERIGRLLSCFRNETVSLDHKTGRLPSFQTLRTEQPTPGGQTYVVADGTGRRWCCLVREGTLEEGEIAAFEEFCRTQSPRPSRKVVIAQDGLELNATLAAKAANMWVWDPDDVALLSVLYGQPMASRSC